MKLHLENATGTEQENIQKKSMKTAGRAKTIRSISAKAPRASASELPILWTLSSGPETGMPARKVIQAVTGWFVLLGEEDRNARYPASKRKITETVLKYSKKDLMIKEEILPVGDGGPQGIWRLTEKGRQRAQNTKREAWKPKYSTHDAVILEEPAQ